MTIKWGNKFAAEYPNLIHRMTKRHMPCEFNSYCMTDNGDGLDDLFIGGAKGSPGKLLIQTASGSFISTNEQ